MLSKRLLFWKRSWRDFPIPNPSPREGNSKFFGWTVMQFVTRNREGNEGFRKRFSSDFECEATEPGLIILSTILFDACQSERRPRLTKNITHCHSGHRAGILKREYYGLYFMSWASILLLSQKLSPQIVLNPNPKKFSVENCLVWVTLTDKPNYFLALRSQFFCLNQRIKSILNVIDFITKKSNGNDIKSNI